MDGKDFTTVRARIVELIVMSIAVITLCEPYTCETG